MVSTEQSLAGGAVYESISADYSLRPELARLFVIVCTASNVDLVLPPIQAMQQAGGPAFFIRVHPSSTFAPTLVSDDTTEVAPLSIGGKYEVHLGHNPTHNSDWFVNTR